jgi:hypothetical protein
MPFDGKTATAIWRAFDKFMLVYFPFVGVPFMCWQAIEHDSPYIGFAAGAYLIIAIENIVAAVGRTESDHE